MLQNPSVAYVAPFLTFIAMLAIQKQQLQLLSDLINKKTVAG